MQTADEYKEELLRKINGDAFLAEKDEVFFTRELAYAETDAIAARIETKAVEAEVLKEYLKAVALAIEDVEFI